MFTRRQLLQGLGISVGATLGLGGYAVAEPHQLLAKRYRLRPSGWPDGLGVRLAVLADLHICEPWMGVDRLQRIVARTNALRPDAVLLLGDYRAGTRMRRFSTPVPDEEWAGVLAGLTAPLGVHAVLGNHDWWDDPQTQITRRGPTTAGLALAAAGITVYHNDAVRLEKAGRPFWLAGLGDQWAFKPVRHAADPRLHYFAGADDLPGTLAKVTDDAPVVLMLHEPDAFSRVPDRVAVTLAGHTHGGQVRILGYTPTFRSISGARYLYGHVVEGNRHLIVSGGLGCSGLPIRVGVPPEIVLLELGDWSAVEQS